jgi:2-amino-4-hydroxy-6-hydroxymethyldihydropteridine diphosphokinase
LNRRRTPSQACLLLGSNIAPERNLPKAIELLALHAQIEDASLVWETPAVGSDGPNFLNAALLVQTDLELRQFKETVIRPVEAYLGRVRSADKYASRPIDIDIVAWDCQVMDPDIWRYAHIAVPVSEVLPCETFSETGEPLAKTAQRLLEETPLQPRLEFSAAARPGSIDH